MTSSWIRRFAHLIDWKTRRLRTDGFNIAVAEAALSSPPNSPNGTWGKARMIDEGVCVSGTLAPLQCKHDYLFTTRSPEVAGQQDPLLDLNADRTRDDSRSIATAGAVSSDPKKPSCKGVEPGRQARISDEGVCASCAVALPQCDFDSPP
jgi:hypothetical protein